MENKEKNEDNRMDDKMKEDNLQKLEEIKIKKKEEKMELKSDIMDKKEKTEKFVENSEIKNETKVEKKEENKEVKKKEEAIANSLSVGVSKKHSMYILRFIKNKGIDQAIADLEKVMKYKRAVPFKGEIPHRKGKMMSGRYPINASKEFIRILKGLKGNCVVNGMDLDKTVILLGSASWASRPSRKGGMRAKRTNIMIKAREIKK